MENMNLLSERLHWAMKKRSEIIGKKITSSKLAEVCGISRAAVSRWFSDLNGIDSGHARKVSQFLEVNPDWLELGVGDPNEFELPRFMRKQSQLIELEENPEFKSIKRVNLKINAGISGFSVEFIDEDRAPIVFRSDWLEKRGFNPERLYAISVRGQSMEPNLFEDDLVVINSDDTRPVDGDVFAVNYDGELVIKRLMKEGVTWYLSSDNADKRRYPNKVCGDGCLIIGRIVYKQSERI